MPQKKKVPFSGKAKRLQLQAKKHRQQKCITGKTRSLLLGHDDDDDSESSEVQKLNFQPSRSGTQNHNRYALQFHRESQEELKERRETARRALVHVGESGLETDTGSCFPPQLDFPKRPLWDSNMSKKTLEAREHRYFTEYIKNIEKTFKWSELSYFELNLETWRQLWRVLEMSDIVLIIVDIRFPSLLFPPSLYEYVSKTLKKDIILVLNKIDLAPAPLVVAWKYYLMEKFPNLHIITFTSFPSYNLRGRTESKSGMTIRRRRGKLKMAAEGAQKLLDVCKEIVGDSVDLSSWQTKINEEMNSEYDDEEVHIGETLNMQKGTNFEEHIKFKDGVLTVGCIGQPNVGKSSLMNALMGKKVVSVSRTPGHTKHFQTIFLTKNIRLCDCPGLVFPSRVPKPIQVLMGSFPIAQLREPFTTVQYLAERIDLVSLLKIELLDGDGEWSAMDICEGWASKKRFFTAKSGRLDEYRAANFILRMALEGKIPLCLTPPNYTKNKEKWANHPEVSTVEWIQASKKQDDDEVSESDDESSPFSEEEPSQPSDDEGEESDDESGEDEGRENKLQSSNRFSFLNVE